MSNAISTIILILVALTFALVLLILVGMISHGSNSKRDNLIILQNNVIGKASNNLVDFRCGRYESQKDCSIRARTCLDNGDVNCPPPEITDDTNNDSNNSYTIV